ncbi:MAG: hypothetical protein V3W34_18455 [Phycisphaerae bacterium]
MGSRTGAFSYRALADADIERAGFQAAFTGSSLKRIPTVSGWGLLGLMLLLLTGITLKFGRRQTLPESSVSFRGACMNRFDQPGIVSRRPMMVRRPGDEIQEDPGDSCPP